MRTWTDAYISGRLLYFPLPWGFQARGGAELGWFGRWARWLGNERRRIRVLCMAITTISRTGRLVGSAGNACKSRRRKYRRRVLLRSRFCCSLCSSAAMTPHPVPSFTKAQGITRILNVRLMLECRSPVAVTITNQSFLLRGGYEHFLLLCVCGEGGWHRVKMVRTWWFDDLVSRSWDLRKIIIALICRGWN